LQQRPGNKNSLFTAKQPAITLPRANGEFPVTSAHVETKEA